jgi:hypothetical protein
MNGIRKVARAGRHHRLTWQYLFNLSPWLSYQFSSRRLSGEAEKTVGNLNRDGVAVTSVGALLNGNTWFGELQNAVTTLEKENADRLAAVKRACDKGAIGQKAFNVELLGENPVLDPLTVYARFALQGPLLRVANAYFGMYTRLRYYNIWHTFATASEARESQLWHRDREDFKILKVFVYLSDVDEGAGALTYAKGSQRSRGLKSNPEFFDEGGVKRSKDEQMAAVVPPENWVQATGPTGTIVFADTSGYHKGGLARERDRLMYVCMFTSPSSQSKELFKRAASMPVPKNKEVVFALKPRDVKA